MFPNRQGSLALDFAASEATETMPAKVSPCAYNAISLYCGAGGLDLGFSRAGFGIHWSIDSDPFAVKTYNTNLEPCAVCGDVLSIDPPSSPQPTLVIGGPPCQGFSVIGRMDPDDPRSQHVDHFFDVVARLDPRAFVMENVKALAASPRWADVRERLLERATALGYARSLIVLNAQDFGVPQSRERMFLIGMRGATPERPLATTAGCPPSVRSALQKLPPFGDPGNDASCAARVVPAGKPVMRPTAHRGSLLFNGSGRPLKLDGPAKTLPASMGGNATPIIDQEELELGAEPWVIGYHRRLQSGKPPLKRAPSRLRRITVQEAAALQTFPANWKFVGPRVAQYRQVGNAVPPRLAEAVALSVRSVLEHQDDAIRRSDTTIELLQAA
ncbi:MAG: DNA cytosine methyltransferase [Solirubrobacteraceae bacterium]